MGSATLNQDTVVGAALDIAGRASLSAVTMRAVAARLDVTAMALYRHVADRDELIRLVADRVGELVRPQPAPHAPWEQRARDWAESQREVLRRYPGVAAWLIDNGPAGPQAYRLLEILLAALTDAGFDDATVARGAATIMSWTFSRVAIEDSADDRVRRRSPTRTTAFLHGLSVINSAEYPAAARVGPEFFTLPLPDVFDAGLAWILAGLGTGTREQISG